MPLTLFPKHISFWASLSTRQGQPLTATAPKIDIESLSLPLIPFVRGEVLRATFSPPYLLVFFTLLCLLSSSSSLPPLLPSSHLSLHSPPISRWKTSTTLHTWVATSQVGKHRCRNSTHQMCMLFIRQTERSSLLRKRLHEQADTTSIEAHIQLKANLKKCETDLQWETRADDRAYWPGKRERRKNREYDNDTADRIRIRIVLFGHITDPGDLR